MSKGEWMRRWLIVFTVLVALLVAALLAGFVALQRIDWNEYKQPIGELVLEATGRRLDLSGDLDFEIGLRPGVDLGGIAFQNASWGSRPEMATVERLSVRFGLLPLLTGKLVVNRIEVVGLDLLLETRADGVGNWDFETSPAAPGRTAEAVEQEPEREAEEEQAIATVLRNVLIEDAVVVLRDAATGGEQRIAVNRLRARTKVSASGESAPLEIELDLEVGVEPIRVTGEISGVPQLQAGGPLSLDLSVEAGGAVVTLAGDVGKPLTGSDLDLDVRFKTARLGPLADVTGGELPNLGPIDLSLSVAGGGDSYDIRDLTLVLGASRMTGRVDVELAGLRPRVVAKLVSPRIDLVDFEERVVKARPMGDPPAEKLFGDEPLPFDSLGLADAELTLAVEELVSGDLVLSGVALALRLEDRLLELDPFQAVLAGGRLDLAVRVDAARKRPRVSVVGKARAIDTGRLAASQGSDVLSGGPLDLDFDVRGEGASLHDIMASLEGRLSLRMGEATLKDEMAGLALSDLKSVLRGEAGSTTARVQCVWADFDIDAGIARPDGIVVDLSSIVLFGEGKIDLRRERFDLEFDRQAHSLSASDVLPPFRVKGPLADPEVGIAAGALGERMLDLGARLLDDDSAVVDERERPVGCEALLARDRQDQAERGSNAEVARKATEDVADQAAKTGKKLFKKLKGLFDR